MKKQKILSLVLAAALVFTSINPTTVKASEITAQTQETETETESETESETEINSETKFETNSETETEIKSETESEPSCESSSETNSETETKKETQTETETETKSEIETETETESISETETETQTTLPEEEVYTAVLDSADGLYQAGSFNVGKDLSEDIDNDIVTYGSDTVENALYKALKKQSKSIDISKYNVSASKFGDIINGVVNDNADVFGYTGCSYTYVNGKVTTVNPKYSKIYKASERTAFDNAVNKALSIINDDMSDLEKAIALHDYIILNCEYDYDNYLNETIPYESYSAYGVFINKIAVCQGYALAYKYLCNKAGIECYMVTSTAMNHAWNLINLNGKYYQVDTTWDDPTADEFGRATHYYMFVSDKEFKNSRNHYSWVVTKGSSKVNLKATDTTYDDYFWTSCNNQMAYFDGAYYYSDGSYWIKKYDLDTNQTTYVADGGWYHSGVYAIGDRLYYNTSNKIMSVEFDGEDNKTVYTLGGNAYIYNSFIDADGKIEYLYVSSSDYTNEKRKLEISDLEGGDSINLISKITLDQTAMAVKTGKTGTITAVVFPSYADALTIEWESSDTSIATVDKGVVKGIKEGDCIITAKAGNITSTCSVSVLDGLLPPEFSMPSDTYAIRDNDITIDKGTQVELTAKAGTLIYYTTDGSTPKKVASQLYTGPITINKNLTIKAITTKSGLDDSEIAVQKFTVCENELLLSASVLTIKEGKSQSLTVKKMPTLSTKNDIEWKITGVENLITYNNGKVNAPSGNDGVATITATTKDHKGNLIKAECKVTVEPLEYTVTFKNWDATVLKTETVKARRDATPPQTSQREYYTFDGWDGDYHNINKNEVLTAVYTANSFKITYNNLANGVNDSENPDTYTIEEQIVIKDAGGRAGYYFDGWYSDEKYSNKFTSIPKGSHENITLYAKWEKLESETGLWVDNIDDQVYTGKALTPKVNVYNGNTLLVENEDYTLSYKNNIKANANFNTKTSPTVYVTGKGNYSGKATATFRIMPIDIETASADNVAVAYSGKAQKPDVTVYMGSQKLKKNTDYTIAYLKEGKEVAAVTNIGNYQIRITGKGTYSGTKTVDLVVTDTNLITKASVSKIAKYTYTGEAITPDITVKLGSKDLTPDSDYTVEYYNNILAGTASVVITGKGEYTGTKRVTFKISAIPIKNAQVNGLKDTADYTGDEITQEGQYSLTINLNNKQYQMKEGTDYSVTYKNNIKSGKATITFKGINSFTGSINKTFTINNVDIANALTAGSLTIDGNKASDIINGNKPYTVQYTKGATTPTPVIKTGNLELIQGVDYTIKYSNNSKVSDGESTAAMIITGKGSFSGTVTVPFTITQNDLSLVTMTVADKVYKNAGGNYEVVPKLTDSNNKALKAGLDYDNYVYTYADNTILLDGTHRNKGDEVQTTDNLPLGTVVTITVSGIGNYTGDIKTNYRLVEKDIKSATIKVANKTYQGKAVTLDESDISIKLQGKTLGSSDYEIVGYENNDAAGTATVTIKGKGNTYGGTKSVKFKITAAKMNWWWNS